jgi:hypothetical protein
LDKDRYIVNLFYKYANFRKRNEKDDINTSYENINDDDSEFPIRKAKERNIEYNRFDVLSDFVHNYLTRNSSSSLYRLDKALINTLILQKEYFVDKTEANVLISFSNVEVGFSFDLNSIEDLTKLLHNNDCHLILCFYYDEESFKRDLKYKEKLKCFKKLIWQNIISGKIFLVKSYNCIKFILESTNFNQFNYLDSLKLYEFIDIMNIDSI